MNAPDNRHQNEECGGVENRHAVILYPAGGAFNKLRPQQRYLEDLLEQHWRAYSLTPPSQKRSFVKEHFIDPMKASGRTFQIFKGRSPDQGRLVTLTEDDSMERLSQKLRDAKKRCLVCKPKKRAKATTRTTTLKSRGGAAKASGKLKPSATKAKTNSSNNHGGKASVAKHRVAAPAPIRGTYYY